MYPSSFTKYIHTFVLAHCCIMIQLIALGTGNVSDVAMMTIQHVMLYVIDTIDLMWPAATSHLLRGPV
jgi:hypothetical protein